MLKHEKTIPEQAELTEKVDQINCSNCFEEYLFHLKDSHHDFTIGLIDILRCLKFAEENGAVPELPTDWWLSVDRRFGNWNDT